ncbi:uncharacterized protein LOC113347180 [Papaver somniferum]|uniref:uncharacterized protein LOC113299474 n=1 Tax=Papaver somniferum TaxID=3469 RepID=UPI000E6F8CA9|nr:uncharacterized protein LOC113299474 [Papaver somniferum]XP_026446566.1 uncharacterized protein LOC113347180 [Papaver somniferum]
MTNPWLRGGRKVWNSPHYSFKLENLIFLTVSGEVDTLKVVTDEENGVIMGASGLLKLEKFDQFFVPSNHMKETCSLSVHTALPGMYPWISVDFTFVYIECTHC